MQHCLHGVWRLSLLLLLLLLLRPASLRCCRGCAQRCHARAGHHCRVLAWARLRPAGCVTGSHSAPAVCAAVHGLAGAAARRRFGAGRLQAVLVARGHPQLRGVLLCGVVAAGSPPHQPVDGQPVGVWQCGWLVAEVSMALLAVAGARSQHNADVLQALGGLLGQLLQLHPAGTAVQQPWLLHHGCCCEGVVRACRHSV
jgi:hypothetical protein